ncbi:MAG: hypothetical protein IT291_10455 [Deltaproteobacteria bacterium]|nr:hypothetical protein [Deltaproteobacteria bacterium]
MTNMGTTGRDKEISWFCKRYENSNRREKGELLSEIENRFLVSRRRAKRLMIGDLCSEAERKTKTGKIGRPSKYQDKALASTTNGALYIPAGKYVINSRLNMNKSNFVLRGAGQGETILYFPKSLETVVGFRDWQNPLPGQMIWGNGSGGLIWIGSAAESGWPAFGPSLALVTTPASKGSSVLTLNKTSGLAVGQYVVLRQADDVNKTLWQYLHGDLISPNDLNPSDAYYWPVKIKAISGNAITLNQPLLFDVRTQWSPGLYTYTPVVKEVGIENLTIEFPDIPYEGHHDEPGYNGFAFLDSLNCWMRNVEVKNADNAGSIGRLSKNVTILNLALKSRTQGSYIDNFGGYSGHHGIYVKSMASNNMVSNLDFKGTFIHEISVDAKANGNVFRASQGEDISFDHHSYSPFANLFSDINVGEGSRPWYSSGNPDVFKSGAWEVFWNIHTNKGQFVKSLPWWEPRSSVVPSQESNWPSDPLDRWGEIMPSITPRDLYLSQFKKRTGYDSYLYSPPSAPSAPKNLRVVQ